MQWMWMSWRAYYYPPFEPKKTSDQRCDWIEAKNKPKTRGFTRESFKKQTWNFIPAKWCIISSQQNWHPNFWIIRTPSSVFPKQIQCHDIWNMLQCCIEWRAGALEFVELRYGLVLIDLFFTNMLLACNALHATQFGLVVSNSSSDVFRLSSTWKSLPKWCTFQHFPHTTIVRSNATATCCIFLYFFVACKGFASAAQIHRFHSWYRKYKKTNDLQATNYTANQKLHLLSNIFLTSSKHAMHKNGRTHPSKNQTNHTNMFVLFGCICLVGCGVLKML